MSDQYLVVGYKLMCEKCGHQQMFDWEHFRNCGAELIREAQELLRHAVEDPSNPLEGGSVNWDERCYTWLGKAGVEK